MALLNTRFYKSGKMFWDERAATAEKQALQPIQNLVEMGLTLAELETKVKALN
jgi:cytochrome c peroxidase